MFNKNRRKIIVQKNLLKKKIIEKKIPLQKTHSWISLNSIVQTKKMNWNRTAPYLALLNLLSRPLRKCHFSSCTLSHLKYIEQSYPWCSCCSCTCHSFAALIRHSGWIASQQCATKKKHSTKSVCFWNFSIKFFAEANKDWQKLNRKLYFFRFR